jgi:hypothetical protein
MSPAELLDAVMDLEREVTDLGPGDPRLGDIATRIDEIEGDLSAQRGLDSPLVPDAGSPPSKREETLDDLERALRSLRSAVASKR